MVRAHDALADAGLTTRTILQIHDELLFEGPAGEAERGAARSSAARWSRARGDGPAAGGRGGHRAELARREVAALRTSNPAG